MGELLLAGRVGSLSFGCIHFCTSLFEFEEQPILQAFQLHVRIHLVRNLGQCLGDVTFD